MYVTHFSKVNMGEGGVGGGGEWAGVPEVGARIEFEKS